MFRANLREKNLGVVERDDSIFDSIDFTLKTSDSDRETKEEAVPFAVDVLYLCASAVSVRYFKNALKNEPGAKLGFENLSLFYSSL